MNISASASEPLLSIVVVAYNMRRELTRTLATLTSDYQRVPANLYEVIVVDNGSSEPLSPESIFAIDPHFRCINFAATSPSPAAAINAAVREARGQALGILIDGARMLSPGVIRYALLALRAYRRPVVVTLGAHLGPKPQQQSVQEGYCQDVEDQLLETIDWRRDGYQLFNIASLAGSSQYGVFAPLAESNALFLPRQLFEELSGFDERFISPGGGLVNLDFYQRALALPQTNLVMLLGEASFHQYHGGVTTRPGDTWSPLEAEYRAIYGHNFEMYRLPWPRTDFLGQIREPFIPWIERALIQRQTLLARMPSDPYEGGVDCDPHSLDRQQRVVAILGMHRSGTSLLAGTLQEAGLFLGDVVTSAPHNQKGNRESLSIRSLHDDLIERAGGSWDEPPSAVDWKPIHRALQQTIIQAYLPNDCWGFKDPRSLICLDGWLDTIPGLEMVAIFRHPEEVARSLQARNGFTLLRGMEIWETYNQRLLEVLDQRPIPLLHFGTDLSLFRAQCELLISQMALPIEPDQVQYRFLDARLRHQKSTKCTLPDHISSLYEELLQRHHRWFLSEADSDQPVALSEAVADNCVRVGKRARLVQLLKTLLQPSHH
jgi:glycosyltransferase involved in cell wall biosynthesis